MGSWLILLHQECKPPGIIWVQFDHPDVGHNTRIENRHLYVQGIDHAWTPIKPVATQFAVGRNKAALVVRKQFSLRPSAAKIIHRSQGDTETKIVANFSTRRTIPHMHYVGMLHLWVAYTLLTYVKPKLLFIQQLTMKWNSKN